MKKEIRCIKTRELRVSKREDGTAVLKGYAAVFNSLSGDLGGFREKIEPGAFKNALARSDCRALFNHDSNYILGRQSAGTLKLKEDKTGLSMEVTLPDTQYARDLMVCVERGDITQQSFGFTVKKDSWEEDRDKKEVTRTLNEIDELFDVSPVTFPAYPDTTVAKRSLDEFSKNNKEKNIMKTREQKVKRLEEISNQIATRGFNGTGDFQKEARYIVADLQNEGDLTDKEQRLIEKLDTSYNEPPAGGQPGGGFTPHEERVTGGPATDKRCRVMFKEPATRGEFKDSEDWFRAFHLRENHDQRLKRSMAENVGSEGGFSLHTEFSDKLWDDSLVKEEVRPRAKVWPMKSADLVVPGWDGNDRSSGVLYGGLAPVWTAEAETGTKQAPKMKIMTLRARKLMLLGNVPNELIEDGIGFAHHYETAVSNSLRYTLDGVFINGNGAGKPLGALDSGNPALITVAKETNQVAGTIIIENLMKMYARLAPQCYRNAVWFVNQTAVPELMLLHASTGVNSGAHVPVLNENNGSFTIFGLPVVFSEHMASLGSQADIALIDWSQYLVGIRREMFLERSSHAEWDSDQTAFRAKVRVAGQPAWSDVVTPLNGDSVSPFITLAERS